MCPESVGNSGGDSQPPALPGRDDMSSNLAFDAFKRKVCTLAKKKKVLHKMPNDDTLYLYWLRGMLASEVVVKHS